MLRIRRVFAAFWLSLGLLMSVAAPVLACAEAPSGCGPALVRPWFKKITFAKTEKALRQAKIVDMQEMRSALRENGKEESGTSPVLLVTLEGGLRAVFKPNLSDMADGEEGAYKISRNLLKSRQIPPTVRRDIGADLTPFRGKFTDEFFPRISRVTEGSLQYFVESTIDLKKNGVWKEVLPKLSQTQKSSRDLFYFVFGQWDRHIGNLIVDDGLNIALIDNSGIRSRQQVRFGELPFRARIWLAPQFRRDNWSETFPFDQAKVFSHPSPEDIYGYLKSFMTLKEWEKFAEAFLKPNKDGKPKDLSSRIVIWQNIVWIQAIGYENYGAIKPEVISQNELEAYASLTFENLRQELSPQAFSDVVIYEMLDRRDQILKVAQTIPRVP